MWGVHLYKWSKNEVDNLDISIYGVVSIFHNVYICLCEIAQGNHLSNSVISVTITLQLCFYVLLCEPECNIGAIFSISSHGIMEYISYTMGSILRFTYYYYHIHMTKYTNVSLNLDPFPLL